MLFAVWSEYVDGRHFLSLITPDNKDAIYGTLTALFGTLLGFCITAVSVVLGYVTSPRVAVMRESPRYQDLWGIFKSAIRVLGFSTVIALIGLFIDKGALWASYMLYLVVFAGLLSAVRVARTIWVLEKIVQLATRPRCSSQTP